MKIARQVAVLVCMSALLLCSWVAPMDPPAMTQVDAGLKRALVSFATARVIGAAISVVQGTQIDIQPAGIGATLAPGQALAPVNELVRHFSNLMLMASVAFGIQKVLITISGFWVISLALSATIVVWTAFHLRENQSPAWLSKALVLLLMLRFAIPVVILGTDALSERFLAADYAVAQKSIDAVAGQTNKIKETEPSTSGSGGGWAKLPNWLPSIPDIKARFGDMTQLVEQGTVHMVKLMVIFLLQTLVMPLLLLWGLYGVVKGTFVVRRVASRQRS